VFRTPQPSESDTGYGASAPSEGRLAGMGERGVIEGRPSRLTETAVSRSWKRGVAPFVAACCAAS
jgi:hypothetical protein